MTYFVLYDMHDIYIYIHTNTYTCDMLYLIFDVILYIYD